jgi:DNA-binding NtrC family response regulator
MYTGWSGLLPISGEVVIVEDDASLPPIIVEALEEFRAKCLVFRSADDALSHALSSHRKCALLITDHGVPGDINGTRLAEIFRAKWPNVPVVITSGYELDTDTLPGGIRYLQKPWAIDSLIEIVAGLVQPGIPVTRT